MDFGRSFTGWMAIGFETWLLGIDAATVIALRGAKLAQGGPDAGHETRLMLSEKASLLLEIQHGFLTGRLGADQRSARRLVNLVRPKVRANRRRLEMA